MFYMSLPEDGDLREAYAKWGMPGRHLLTFELSEEGDELSIHGDPTGLRLLADRLSTLAAQAETESEPGSAQLSTSVWGGNELSLELQGTDTRLVYQVRIVARPLARKK